MDRRIKLTVTDALGFYDDYLGDYTFNPNYTPTNTYFYKVPNDWIEDDQLKVEKIEMLFAHLYGPTWRMGNADGSRYIIVSHEAHVLNEEEKKQEWLERKTCYVVRAEDIEDTSANDF